jgi:hypothetical protein
VRADGGVKQAEPKDAGSRGLQPAWALPLGAANHYSGHHHHDGFGRWEHELAAASGH